MVKRGGPSVIIGEAARWQIHEVNLEVYSQENQV